MSYLSFSERSQVGKKTRLWWVESGNACLGRIKWFSHWRKYCFYPDDLTLYDPSCLREIADFCDTQTKIHKEKGKER